MNLAAAQLAAVLLAVTPAQQQAHEPPAEHPASHESDASHVREDGHWVEALVFSVTVGFEF